ncbi:MAG TPA: TonB-dependent receptor [Terriglobia bacterium]|nr:TonB-dependent receptor [Terriglobia bacterium]
MQADSQKSRIISRQLLILFAVFVLTAGAGLRAQVQAGRIVGTIFDAQHATIPGAAVRITNIATNITKDVTTDAAGNYVLTPVEPGAYTVSATKTGFKTSVESNVEVTVSRSVRVDLTLAVGEATTQVSVTAVAPLLNTGSGSLGQVINTNEIENMPLNGRSFTELAQLAPGAVELPPTGNTESVRPEVQNGNDISGVAGNYTTFLLDGVDITEEHQGGTWIVTPLDALQEFNLQQNDYSAEYPGAGPAFNTTSKSGTNRFHGDLFEYFRNDAMDARNFFAKTTEPLKQNQFGGTIGGPIQKDKTFFFAAYEGQTQRQGLVSVALVPGAAERNGDFSAPGLHKIYDPATTTTNSAGQAARAQFANNVIPPSMISKQATFFDQYIPLPNFPDGTFHFTPVQGYNYTRLMFRVDRQLNTSNRLFVRYSEDLNSEDNGLVNPSTAFPALDKTPLSGSGYNAVVALTSTLSSRLIQQLRLSGMFGEYRSTAYFQGQGANILQQAGVTGLQGLQNPATSSIPGFSFSGYTGFQGMAYDGRPKYQDRYAYELNDNLTWIKGKHTLKFGGRVYYRKILFTDSRNQNGVFSYTGVMSQNPASSSGTGDAFADWLLGYPANVGRSNPATWWGGYGTFLQPFFQDDWNVTPRLTLNLGLRYEYTPWLTPYRGQGATFDPNQSKPIIVSSNTNQINLGAQPAAVFGYQLYGNLIQTTHQAGLPITVTANDEDQFGPRAAFAWRPFGERTVVRGGFGVFYAPERTDNQLNFNYLPYSLSETINAEVNVVPTRTTADFFLGQPFGSGISAASWSPLPEKDQFSSYQHWNFGIERQLNQKTLLSVDYVGTRGQNIVGSHNINNPPPGPGSVQARRPYQGFGSINYTVDVGSSIYHSLQVRLERRAFAGLSYLASYTYSKSISTNESAAAGGDGYMERALTGFDVPQLFTFSSMYDLPFAKGNRILGGWRLQGIFNYRSGLPFTPTISRDVANIGVGGQRPTVIGSCSLANPTLNDWFNQASFAVPAAYTYGNAGANICRADHAADLDLSVSKAFAVTENTRLQLRVEAFNLPNTPYFSAPSGSVDTSSGAKITSTSNNPRQIQLVLKYIF